MDIKHDSHFGPAEPQDFDRDIRRLLRPSAHDLQVNPARIVFGLFAATMVLLALMRFLPGGA